MDNFFISSRFNTYEAFSQAAKAWELDFIQLDSGSFLADVCHYGDDELRLAECQWSRKLHQRGTSPPGYYTFALYAPSSITHSWRLIDCPENSIRIFPEDNELNSVTPPGCHNLVITVAEEYLQHVAIDLGYPDFPRFIKRGDVICCNPAHIQLLQYTLQKLRRTVEYQRRNGLQYGLTKDTKWQVIRFLLQALYTAAPIKYRKPQIKKSKVVNRILGYVEANISEDMTVADLCKIAEVSERTLRYIFNDYFTVSPQKYIRNLRLNKIKNELTSHSCSTVMISDIANTNGLWHMGKFAADYRSLFEELPSQTLKGK